MRRINAATVVLTMIAIAAVGIAQGPPPGGQGQRGGAPGGAPGAGARGGARAGGGIFPRVPSLPFPAAAQTIETIHQKIRVVPHVRLENPWSIAFLPNGDLLVTEKAGRLRVVRNGTLVPQPVSGTPQVVSAGQGGLLEVLPHPRFNDNRWIYLTYSKAGPQGNTTALARGRLDANGTALTDVKDIFVADAWSMGPIHFGSKLAWSRDGMLFMTIGERNERDRAQRLTDHAGKVLRLTEEGAPAPGNPFMGRTDAKPEIYTYGNRNLQGLAIHPDTGALWETEHGPQGGDELNLIQPGKNYGWPVITYGREYTGEVIAAQPAREGMEQPVIFWAPSIGLSGMAFYTGDRLPGWKGNLFLGGLSGQYLQRVVFNDRGVHGREPVIPDLRLRIRDVRQGPDGFLYLAVDAPQGGILRIEPAE
jgi:glucose/arabinose dehydrogenase